MASSASASPITLLASPAAPTAAATSASKTSTPAPDGGFQLLVDTATQQQLEAQLANDAAATAVATPTDGSDAATDAGNVLPLANLLLPVDGDQPPAADGDAKKTDATQDDTDADAAAAAASATIPLPWVPINIQPPSQPAAATNNAPAAKKTDSTDPTIAALAASAGGIQLTAPAAPAANAAGNAAATTDDDAATASVEPVSIPKTQTGIQLGAGNPAPAAAQPERQASADNGTGAGAGGGAKPGAELLTGAPATDDKGTTSVDAGKANDVASFADLLKPAANAQSQAANGGQQPAAPVAALDGGRTHQAARSYLDVGNSAATATVNVPVGSSGWSDAVVDKVMWFSANQLNSAEIKLNPPDLGPLQVRISTQHDQTSVVFSSPHAAVRDALDQALPRLRDMFGGQGLQLTDASVGGQAQRQQQQQQQGNNGASAQSGNFWFGSEDNGDTPVAVTRVSGPRLSTSAVDAYA